MSTGREIAATVGPIGYALAAATRAHRTLLQERLADLGLHLGQELIVVDLHEHPDSTQVELVERIGVEQPTIARSISRLENADFVVRVRSDDDRRVVHLRLTARGEAAYDQIIAAWSDTDTTSTRHLSDNQQRTLTRLLRQITDNLSER